MQDVNRFLTQFESGYQDVSTEANRARTLPTEDVDIFLDKLAVEKITALEQLTTTSAHFLPAYELRQAKLRLQQLHDLTQALRAELCPKSKFSFKSKRKAKAESSAAPVSSEQPSASDIVPSVASTAVSSAALHASSSEAPVSLSASPAPFEGAAPQFRIEAKTGERIHITEDLRHSELTLEQLSNCVISIASPVLGCYINQVRAL